jgi:hypothetical protein
MASVVSDASGESPANTYNYFLDRALFLDDNFRLVPYSHFDVDFPEVLVKGQGELA